MVLDHSNKVSHMKFLVSQVHVKVMFTLYYSLLNAVTLCVKTMHTLLTKYFIGKNTNQLLSLQLVIIFLLDLTCTVFKKQNKTRTCRISQARSHGAQ